MLKGTIMKSRTALPFLLAVQLVLCTVQALACKHTPLEWQQRVEKHAIPAMVGQQKHLTWVRDKNHNFIDDEIEARFHAGEIVNVVVDLNHCLTPGQIKELLAKYGRIRYIGKMVTFVILDAVRFEELPKIAVLRDVAMIEWQVPGQVMNDVSNRAIQARASNVFSPNTAQDLGFDGAGVNIAILDTGVDDGHEAFTGKFVAGFNALNAADPGDGSTHPGDDNGHGTHVAGIALAKATAGRTCRNPGGTPATNCSGVAPAAGVLAIKVCDAFGSCPQATVQSGLDWLGTNMSKFNVRVANMSLGFCTDDDGTNAMSQQINYLAAMGVNMAVALGNSGNCGLMPGTQRVMFPGSASLAITVAGTDDRGTVTRTDDTIVTFALAGPRLDFNMLAPELAALKPDISAPGNNIFSAQAGTVSGYVSDSGTSMSSPHVAGAAALIVQAKPGINTGSLKNLLKQNADTSKNTPTFPAVDPVWDREFGSGMLTLFPALSQVAATDVKFPTCTNTAISPGGLCVLSGGLPAWDNTVDISTATPPQVGVPNTITVQVRNDGPATANVLVNFGIYKFGAGSPLFFHVGTVAVSIPAMTTVPVSHSWTPANSDHQCVLASIDFGLDTNFANNVTQRNLQVAPSIFTMEIENPFLTKARFQLRAKSQREGWQCRLAEENFTIDPEVDCPRRVRINFDAPPGTKPGERANCDIGVYGAPEGKDMRLIGGVTAQTYVPVPCRIVGVVVDAQGNPVPQAKLLFQIAPAEKESPSHAAVPNATAVTDASGTFYVELTPDIERLITVEGRPGKGDVLATPFCGQPMRFVLTAKGVTEHNCGGTSCPAMALK
jgi:subtilisin family serine protease